MRHPFLWPVYALCGAIVFIVIVGSARQASRPAHVASQQPAPAAPLAAAAVQPTAAPVAPTATQAPPPPTEPPAPTAAPTATPATQRAARSAEPKPAPPTSTPRAAEQVVDFTGAFKPTLLRVGEKLVIELGIENKSDRPIEGVRISSSGPWDKYTVVNVLPAGEFESGLLQYNIHSKLTIPPGQRRFVNVVAYPNEPGNHEFTFIPHQDTRRLVGDDGKGIVIGGKVSVTR